MVFVNIPDISGLDLIEILTYIMASILFAIGVIYLFFYCCLKDDLKSQLLDDGDNEGEHPLIPDDVNAKKTNKK